MTRIFRDPISGLTHLLGAFLGVAGLFFLLRGTTLAEMPTAPFAVFGVSLILLYASSALYHLLHLSDKNRKILRRVDHTMIFVLIAGTYTPFCLVPLRGPWGYSILGVVWGLAFVGLFISIFWLHAPRALSTGLYLAMGWLIVVAAYPLFQTTRVESLIWLGAGGLFYSVGAVVYAMKWPNPFPDVFGFHEIWHLFVLAGSASHFVSVASLLS